MPVKILVSDGLSPDGLALLGKSGEVVSNPKITPAELLAARPEYDALVVRSRTKVTAPVLGAGLRLRVVGRAGVRGDNIDVAAAVVRGAVVVTSPIAAWASVDQP